MKGFFIHLIKLVALLVVATVASVLLFTGASAADGAEMTCSISFFNMGVPYHEYVAERGSAVSLPEPPARMGYDFDGWRVGSQDGEPLDTACRIDGDLRLYAAYKLSAPEFEISSLAFEYDGTEHILKFSSVTHPLLEGGFLSYDWYKDGVSLGHHAAQIGVKNVADSGSYTCIITFSVMGDSSTSITPDIEVEISRAPVDIPTIPHATYSGDEIYPQIFDTGTYLVDRRPCLHAGIYPIAVTLRDPENYTFRNSSSETVYANFQILRADNFWISPLSVHDVYSCSTPSPSAISRFGVPRFEFSSDGKSFSTSVPNVAGEYLVRSVVEGCEDYTSLVTEPVTFRIIAEEVAGIAVATPAEKLKYVAFECFDSTGLTVSVTYNSGRRTVVSAEELTISYPHGDSFRFSDRGIVVSYGSASVLLLVEVSKADYDLSGVTFSDSLAQYDGTYKTGAYSGRLPVGLDGIPLRAEVVGGGVNAGVYSVRLEFSADSDNYNSPLPLYASLTVEPRPVFVEWSSLTFVYDGEVKLPFAYYLDVNGRRCELTPSGARSLAGAHTAEVFSPDANYTFLNPTASFEIMKADYDMSCAVWCGGGQAYDGTVHEVYLTSLPDGVFVIGYVDNKATSAGTYVARASLSFDDTNYNPPAVPEHVWQILPAYYADDSYTFEDVSTVFDGDIHYPSLVGEMPVGADGVRLEYSFSTGAVHVAEGRVAVEISFHTDSTNYIPPENIVRYVQISPLFITVSWHALDFVYDGSVMTPYALADESTITVTGGAINAGTYVAVATADNSDYAIINGSCEFTVRKADNAWLTPLSVSDAFCGRLPSPYAAAIAGEVIYEYFSDPDCVERLSDAPTDVGTYYVRAISDGDGNYNAIASEAKTFSIIAVVPISLSVTLSTENYFAFDTISPTDLIAVIIHNDGSELQIDGSSIEILYQSAESLRYGDASVEARYGEFAVTLTVSVEKRSYDMSSAVWEGIDHTYDGTPKHASLVGLPDGVDVTEYIGNGETEAGEYSVAAILSFDEQNYNAPDVTTATMTIRKLVVPLPTVERAFYCGAALLPDVQDSPYYSFSFSLAPIAAGSYPIAFTLVDPDNCEFPSGLAEMTVDFVVEPRPIVVVVEDCTLYLFEKDISPSWSITGGELVQGDALSPRFYEQDGKIYAEFDNHNYSVTVSPGNLVRKATPSPKVLSVLLPLLFALLALIFVVVVIIKSRKRLYYAYRARVCRAVADEAATIAPPSTEPPNTEPPNTEPPNTELPSTEQPCSTAHSASPESIQSVEGVDVEYADTAITNSLAKDLIRREVRVATTGRRRGIINVDTLSDNFAPGERVDINIMKSRSLIPYDTAYIKVLARGVIDKPLFVYANDFSLAAVKMIALKGGRAIKVTTVSKIKLSKGIEMPDEK